MPATRPSGVLRQKAAEVISLKLRELSVTRAAHDLGVSRQAIYGFKSGEYCPSLAVIQRACTVWGLEFNIQGMTINDRVFSPRPAKSKSSKKSERQITMFDLWEQLEHRRMTVVRAERVDGAVEMTLRISIPA
jgi:predicted transcriptional regulator